MRLKDKAIIVTGSTTGIGEAIARRCVAEGARVVINGLEEDLGQKVLSEIRAQAGSDDAAILAIEDLSDPDVPAKLVDTAVKAFGRLDAVVNNAAWVARSDIHTTDAELFDRVIAINTRAPLLMIRAALPHLEKNRGNVLNIGSVNAWAGEPTFVAYSASKGALTTLTRNLGDTLHRENGVRINQINPGWVLTDNEIKYQQDQGQPADWYTKVPKVFAPSGRLFSPDELAECALYFLSDASGPVSGCVVDINQFPVLGRNPPKV